MPPPRSDLPVWAVDIVAALGQCGDVSEPASQSAFDEWLAFHGGPSAVSQEMQDMVRSSLGDTVAPVRDSAQQALDIEQVSMAEGALARVLDDIHRTTALRPSVSVRYFYGVWIRVDDGYEGSSLEAPDPQTMLQEVANYMQDFVMSDNTVWPTCSAHQTGLHADLIDGVAVWRCQYGDHTVAVIGQLTQS
jgi:hypothetical protein